MQAKLHGKIISGDNQVGIFKLKEIYTTLLLLRLLKKILSNQRGSFEFGQTRLLENWRSLFDWLIILNS